MKNLLTLAYILLFFIFPINSYAYIEIGTGSILLQSAFGVLISLFVFYQQFCQFVKKYFKKLMGCQEKQEDTEPEQGGSI